MTLARRHFRRVRSSDVYCCLAEWLLFLFSRADDVADLYINQVVEWRNACTTELKFQWRNESPLRSESASALHQRKSDVTLYLFDGGHEKRLQMLVVAPLLRHLKPENDDMERRVQMPCESASALTLVPIGLADEPYCLSAGHLIACTVDTT